MIRFALYLSALIKDLAHPSYLYRALRNARDNLLDYVDKEHKEVVDLSILDDTNIDGDKSLLSFFNDEDKEVMDKLVWKLVFGSCLHNHSDFINKFKYIYLYNIIYIVIFSQIKNQFIPQMKKNSKYYY